MPGRALSCQLPAQASVRSLLIVGRDEPELYQRLQRRLRHCTLVTLLVDRRTGDRRQAAQPVLVDRRRGERRRPPQRQHDLRERKYVFVRPYARRPHD